MTTNGKVKEVFGEERATLARQMRTYLNQLEGAAYRGERDLYAAVFEAQENVIAARLAALPDIKKEAK